MTTGWERLALFEGGSVADLAAAQAADGSWHAFAATAVGVFRSVDRGRTWVPLGVGRRVAGAEVVAASPRYAEDRLVYAGAPDGLYCLQGDTESWQHVLSGGPIRCVALDAGVREARPDGSGLTVFVGTQEDGILVSRNGGRIWAGANAGLLSLCVYDLALSPSFAEDGIAFAAMDDGLYRTRNGAESWRQLDTDTEDDLFDAVAVSPTFSEDRLVLASCYNQGLFRSDDGGRSWSRVDLRDPDDEDDADDEPQYGSFGDIFRLTLLSSERAIAWTELGVARSADGGQSWRLDWESHIAQGVEQVTGGVLLPAAEDEPQTLLAGTADNGVLRSEDDGKTWAPSSSGLYAALTSGLLLSPHVATDQTLYTPALGSGLLRSTDGGHTWHTIRSVDLADDEIVGDDYSDEAMHATGLRGPGSSISPVAAIPSPAGGTTLIGTAQYGLYVSDDGGVSWGRAWREPPIRSAELTFESIDVVATAATSRGIHIMANVRGGTMAWFLVGSRDGGQTWTEIPTPNRRAFVRGLAISPDVGLDGVLYVAVHNDWDGDFTLWRSADSGRRWQPWHADPELRSQVATPFVPLPANPWGDTVIMALGDRVLRPRPHAWEVKEGVRRPAWDATTLADEVQTGWTVAIAGLAASPDYAQDRTLFAATSAGVYVSRDGGASFSPWNEGLEPLNVVAAAVSPAYGQDRLVYALGLGGSIWRRTDG